MTVTNDSGNESIFDVIETRLVSRRGFLKTSAGATAAAAALGVLGTNVVAGLTNTAQAAPPPVGGIGFTSIAANLFTNGAADDRVTVPAGYSAKVLVAWGDSLTLAPNWDSSGAMDEATQLHSYGAHTDGMHFFPHTGAGGVGLSNTRGILCTNSEYVDPPLVNNITPRSAYSTAAITLDMVRAQQAGHGVNILKIVKNRSGNWEILRNSYYNRRITGNTPCLISGPAKNHPLMRTAADPKGRRVLGTLNNCAHGYTPWGTYLTCEENWNGYFGTDATFLIPAEQSRYGISRTGFGYRWHEVDQRFRADLNPNEPNRFGWVVEIDPFNPDIAPVKRTAMGRIKHEGAVYFLDANQRLAYYMGDDERNEYIYKFVCANPLTSTDRTANRTMLDVGTLYVAKFNAGGTGVWLPLVHGQNGLTAVNGFADQGEVLIKTRQAADLLGATMMDRPEWGAVHPVTGEVYMTLTNNLRRGNNPPSSNNPNGTSGAASTNPPVDAANPRPDNDYGHIIRWREDGSVVTATTFTWDIFVKCGDKNSQELPLPAPKTLPGTYNPAGHDNYFGNISGDDYGAPDGLWFDQDGRLWIQTDQQGDATGDWRHIGSNVMMCADPSTGETRRFLTSPRNCEVTGVTGTPDGKTFFVGIQHPGEDWVTTFLDNSTWPDSVINGPTTQVVLNKPRSGVVVITKDDGGKIGS